MDDGTTDFQRGEKLIKTVYDALKDVLDKTVLLKRGQQAKDGRLVHLQPARQISDPHFRLGPQELEDLERPIQRLHFVARHETGAHGTTTIAPSLALGKPPKALW